MDILGNTFELEKKKSLEVLSHGNFLKTERAKAINR